VFVPFTAQTRMSGVDCLAGVRSVRKGAADAVRRYVTERAASSPTR
jgi:K+-transporting ATPase ATPase B chain